MHGLIENDEFAQHAMTIKSHPQFDPRFDEIVDVRGVTEVRILPKTLQSLAADRSVYSAGSVHVVVAPKGHLTELAKEFQGAAESTRPKFFVVRTPEEAYECIRRNRTLHN